MLNFAAEIKEAAGGEAIESVIIGQFGWGGGYGEDRIERKVEPRRNELLTWDEARPMLDYDFSAEFGAPECDAIWAWTETRVIGVETYDGSTNVFWIPRNPTIDDPRMYGEG